MTYHVPERLRADRSEPVIVDSTALPWTPSPLPGVERRFLEREGAEIARATSIVRYAPRSRFSAHVHEKGEEFLVLEGTFSDEHGDFGRGTYVRNPPGSRHAPFTDEGCVIFVKLRQMDAPEHAVLVVRTRGVEPVPAAVEGLSRIPLHRGPAEEVAIEVLAPGCRWGERGTIGGEEIFVLDGELRYGDERCRAGSWIRFPCGSERGLASPSGCRLWTKRGHLVRAIADAGPFTESAKGE